MKEPKVIKLAMIKSVSATETMYYLVQLCQGLVSAGKVADRIRLESTWH